jgi:signal transduction histidine kinase
MLGQLRWWSWPRRLNRVRLDLVPALAAAGTQLTLAVPPDLVVSFSPANLRSIVYNLLSNAIKYRALDRPSHVQVHAEPSQAGVVLRVQDNGLGMSSAQQRQLFGLFQRLHTHVEGTGVGLYITKRLVENAGGTIAVQSQPDMGTTFTLTFPA